METKEKVPSCVFKKSWQFYKTCYECGQLRQCDNEHKPNVLMRLIEPIVVGWYRRHIKLKMKRLFAGHSKREIKNSIYLTKQIQKHNAKK